VVTAGSIQDPRGYLGAVSDQGPGYAEYFGRMGLRTRFHQAVFHSEGALQSSHHHFLALYRNHLIIGHYQAGLNSDTSSSAGRSIWHLKFTDASHACKMPSPKMNSAVILATSTLIFREITTSFKGGGLPQMPSAVCSFGSAVGTFSDTYSSVLTVTRHGLSPIQPCVSRLGSTLPFMTARGGGGGGGVVFMCKLAFPLSRRHSLVSRRLAIPPVRLSIVSRSPIGPSCRSRVLEVFHLVSRLGYRVFPPSRRGSCLAPRSSSKPILFGLFAQLEATAPPKCPGARFFGSGC
jgi:hypothetical protein